MDLPSHINHIPKSGIQSLHKPQDIVPTSPRKPVPNVLATPFLSEVRSQKPVPEILGCQYAP